MFVEPWRTVVGVTARVCVLRGRDVRPDDGPAAGRARGHDRIGRRVGDRAHDVQPPVAGLLRACPPRPRSRASRPTMTPFDAARSFAFSSAAAPATSAAEADVPVIDVVAPSGVSAVMPTPGAAMNVSCP